MVSFFTEVKKTTKQKLINALVFQIAEIEWKAIWQKQNDICGVEVTDRIVKNKEIKVRIL